LYQCLKDKGQLKSPTCFGTFVIHFQGVLNVLDWNYLRRIAPGTHTTGPKITLPNTD